MQSTTINDFSESPELKFAVITKEAWQADPVAQNLSSSPRHVEHAGVDLVVLSIPSSRCLELFQYVGGAVEFGEITIGSGLVSLLLHNEVFRYLPEIKDDE
ncbi:hypothetical protein ABC502_07990 [Alkalimonas sp. NCh-2]|uniref:hypothetical protein n=1 Tax=Alkalimonas sp. NCh-2 TaxID=3144846 RepID=UPI0031F62C69